MQYDKISKQNKTSTMFQIAMECYNSSENIEVHLLKPAIIF